MARSTRSKRSITASVPQKVRQLPHWSRLTALIVGGILMPVSIIAMLAAQAGTYPNALVSVSDVNGGFYNGLTAIDPATGKSLGSLAGDMPQLAGCSSTQNKAYISDIAIDSTRRQIFASLKACPGGTLSDAQAMARFDVANFRFAGLSSAPGSGAKVLANSMRNQMLALSADGLRLQVLETSTGRVLSAQTFAPADAVTRWAIDGSGNALLATINGKAMRLNLANFSRADLAQTGLSLPNQASTPDISRVVNAGGNIYFLGKQNGNPVLIEVTAIGQVATYPLANEPMSLTANPAGDHIFTVTGCPSGSCTDPSNRIYAFNIASKQFERAGTTNYFPLQTLANQIRYSADNTDLYFDGVVVGSAGVGQRFVFSLDANGTAPTTARVAVPGSRWEPMAVTLPDTAPGQGPITVDPSIPSGGGIGGGTIATSPVPLDEIERLIGMPISMIDWSKITDEQIRAFGYDPAMVRRYIAQYALQSAQGGVGGGLGAQASCAGIVSSLTAEQIKAIEASLGMPIDKLDFSKVTDAQIQAFGYNPQQVRSYLSQLKAQSGDSCANVYTQQAFVAPYGSSAQAGGTVSNMTVQPVFDLFAGGWLMELRWQAPGGAAAFHIFARDNHKNPKEKRLATVGPLERKARFGGFGRLGLPAISDDTYVLSVVPQESNSTLGVPTGVVVRSRCFVVFCTMSPAK